MWTFSLKALYLYLMSHLSLPSRYTSSRTLAFTIMRNQCSRISLLALFFTCSIYVCPIVCSPFLLQDIVFETIPSPSPSSAVNSLAEHRSLELPSVQDPIPRRKSSCEFSHASDGESSLETPVPSVVYVCVKSKQDPGWEYDSDIRDVRFCLGFVSCDFEIDDELVFLPWGKGMV
jgi:hypothetical protein